MLNGVIITYGKKAVTIQTEGGHQFYGPKENIKDDSLINCLTNGIGFIPVKFMVDYEQYSGKTKYGKRFYAYDIKLDVLVF